MGEGGDLRVWRNHFINTDSESNNPERVDEVRENEMAAKCAISLWWKHVMAGPRGDSSYLVWLEKESDDVGKSARKKRNSFNTVQVGLRGDKSSTARWLFLQTIGCQVM